VANWVDVFAPVLCAGELPTRWPDTLLIDAKGFVCGGLTTGRRFHVLGAVGIEQPVTGRWRSTPKAWRLEPFPRKDTDAWVEFLSALEGMPRVILADADRSIRNAVAAVFPRPGDPPPEARISQHHLRRSLESKLPLAVVARAPERALPLAFTTAERWTAFAELCKAEDQTGKHPMRLVMDFFAAFGELVAAQATRSRRVPNSTGPVEAALREVATRIASTASPIASAWPICRMHGLRAPRDSSGAFHDATAGTPLATGEEVVCHGDLGSLVGG
jgi:hypothetical protein